MALTVLRRLETEGRQDVVEPGCEIVDRLLLGLNDRFQTDDFLSQDGDVIAPGTGIDSGARRTDRCEGVTVRIRTACLLLL